jgi:CRP-like cAMP-binding protein
MINFPVEMDARQLIEFLHSSNLVSFSKAEEIAAHFAIKEFTKNELILKEGQISDEYIFLQKGFIRAFAHDLNANEVTTNFYTGGQLVFEVHSFFNRTRSKENIQALTDCTTWYITYEQLNMLFHSIYEFREFGRSVLVKGFANLKNRMLSTITETAEDRYASLLKSNPEIFQQAQLKHIASYLGITDSSLSRIRKEFSKK